MKHLLALLLITPLLAQDPVTRLACGSCYKPERDKGLWKTIAADKPQAFLFMGDNIYGDTEDAEVMAEKYRRLNAVPDYADFRKTIPILPTWDDHDYGKNDAGREFPFKETSAKLFFEAFHFPADHEARQTPGIYHSKMMGPEGKRLQIINLDTRTFRSGLPQIKEGKRDIYVPQSGPEATMLGKAQWAWLATELKKPADFRIIVSSVQILANTHRFEKWANMPDERARFFKLLKDTKSGPTLLLSGDRHLAEVCKIDAKESGLPYDLFEMTSSGMSHAGAPDDRSPYRVPNTYYRSRNYGLIDINWEKEIPKATLTINGFDGTAQSKTNVIFPEKS